MIWLSGAEFELRAVRLTARFDHLGETRVQNAGWERPRRRLTWEISAPAEHWVEAEFRYSEWYHRDGSGWQMVKYHYDYFDRIRGGRRGYHCHDMAPARAVSHAHCEAPGSTSSAHYRHIELDLIEAHEELEAVYAAENGVSCGDLRPLRRDMLPPT